MIGPIAADDLVFARMPRLSMILPRQLHGGLRCFRTAAQQLHGGYAVRRETQQLLGECERGRARSVQWRREREQSQLPGHCIDHGLVAVTEAGYENAREPIDELLIIGGPELNATALHEDKRRFRELLHLHEVEEQRRDDVRMLHHGPASSCAVALP